GGRFPDATRADARGRAGTGTAHRMVVRRRRGGGVGPTAAQPLRPAAIWDRTDVVPLRTDGVRQPAGVQPRSPHGAMVARNVLPCPAHLPRRSPRRDVASPAGGPAVRPCHGGHGTSAAFLVRGRPSPV